MALNYSHDKVWHDDRGDLCRGLHPPEQRGDGAGPGDGEPEQAGVRPGDDHNITKYIITIIITGDRDLQPPREGDLLRRDHRVHGLGQRGQAPRHHQARDTSDDRGHLSSVLSECWHWHLRPWHFTENYKGQLSCLQWWSATQRFFSNLSKQNYGWRIDKIAVKKVLDYFWESCVCEWAGAEVFISTFQLN